MLTFTQTIPCKSEQINSVYIAGLLCRVPQSFIMATLTRHPIDRQAALLPPFATRKNTRISRRQTNTDTQTTRHCNNHNNNNSNNPNTNTHTQRTNSGDDKKSKRLQGIKQ